MTTYIYTDCCFLLYLMAIKCLFVIITGGSLCSGTLLCNTPWGTLSIRRVGGDINVFLRAGTHVETRNIYKLSPNTDMTLTDENTGMVDRLGKTLLEHLRLKTTFKKLLSGELKDEIKFELVFPKETVATHPTEERSTLEDAFGVLRVEGKQSTGGLTKLGQRVLTTPDFTLASETVFPHKFELRIKTLLLEGTTRGLVGLPVVPVLRVGWHGCSII
mmetsp:Transcript_3579/g.6358  ORF Transcript_3579/g.6358 Transcript_3579/m.6358 type:complete len:217 (+) Transcript_3579:24-674(+)